MVVFWILWSVAMVFCVANLLFTVHMLVSSSRLFKGLSSWAEEIDKSNFNYIKQEFARLKYENGLVLAHDNNNNNNSLENESEIMDGEDVE